MGFLLALRADQAAYDGDAEGAADFADRVVDRGPGADLVGHSLSRGRSLRRNRLGCSSSRSRLVC
jgi:hypothetical protein